MTMIVVVEFFRYTDLGSERVVGKMKGGAGDGVEVAMWATFMRERVEREVWSQYLNIQYTIYNSDAEATDRKWRRNSWKSYPIDRPYRWS